MTAEITVVCLSWCIEITVLSAPEQTPTRLQMTCESCDVKYKNTVSQSIVYQTLHSQTNPIRCNK